MEGVLDNLRQGLERLEEKREREKAELDRKRARDEPVIGEKAAKKAHPAKSAFAETMATINRMSSSFRRCYWKSGAEMIFPILYGHMTFASHRCWTVYVKKAVFQAAESWRRQYGSSVRHAAIKAGGGEIIQHIRKGDWGREEAEAASSLVCNAFNPNLIVDARSSFFRSFARHGSVPAAGLALDQRRGPAASHARERHQVRDDGGSVRF